MAFSLDHIVIAVHDLAQASRDYTELGFTVVPGGVHPGRPTHNALVVLADGVYFELIAWREPAPLDRWWQLLQAHGEGIVDVALLPRDTAAAVQSAAARGLQLSGPHDGGRERPDGERLRWQTARPPSGDLPFLCGDVTPRALRVPEGAVRQHANGATGVQSLTVAVHDLDASLSRWRALLGGDVQILDTPLAGSGTRVGLIRLGTATVVLAATRVPQADEALTRQLAGRGEGPLGLVLSAATAAAADTALAHGARIEFAAAAAR